MTHDIVKLAYYQGILLSVEVMSKYEAERAQTALVRTPESSFTRICVASSTKFNCNFAVCPGLQLIKVVCPLLHHLASLGKVRRAVVGAPVRVFHRVEKLVFDVIRAHAENFIKNGPRHSTKPMSRHFIFGDTHATHGGEDGVIAHRTTTASRTREYELTAAREHKKLTQNDYSLAGQRNDMWGAGLASHVTPLSGVEVNVLPLRLAQLAGAREAQRGMSESAHYDERSLIAIHNPQKLTHARGLSNRCKMVALYRGKGASQIAGRLSLSSTGGNGIPEYPSAVAQRSMCSVQRATAFNATYHGEQFGGGNAGNWPSTDPWKNVTF